MSEITKPDDTGVGKHRPRSRMIVKLTMDVVPYLNYSDLNNRSIMYAALSFHVGDSVIVYSAKKTSMRDAVKVALYNFIYGVPERWHRWHSRMFYGRTMADVDFDVHPDFLNDVEHAILLKYPKPDALDEGQRLIES